MEFAGFESDQRRRSRLFNNLSTVFSDSALVQALRDTQQVLQPTLLYSPQLSSNDDLKPLDWLQSSNVLKIVQPMGSDGESLDEYEVPELNTAIKVESSPSLPYHPDKQKSTRPPYSFSCLIFMSIEDSRDKKLSVREIYDWIMSNYPYYHEAQGGWKNSVRHNLSLNKCFRRVEGDRALNRGKGSLWEVDPDFRPNLMLALRRAPYSPSHERLFGKFSVPIESTPKYTMFPSLNAGAELESWQDESITEAAQWLVDLKNSAAPSNYNSDNSSDVDTKQDCDHQAHKLHILRSAPVNGILSKERIEDSEQLKCIYQSDHTYTCLSVHLSEGYGSYCDSDKPTSTDEKENKIDGQYAVKNKGLVKKEAKHEDVFKLNARINKMQRRELRRAKKEQRRMKRLLRRQRREAQDEDDQKLVGGDPTRVAGTQVINSSTENVPNAQALGCDSDEMNGAKALLSLMRGFH